MKPNVPPPKKIPCRNCKSTKLIHKFRLTGPAAGADLASGVLDFFQCCDCSLVFSNLRLSEADLLELYGSSYFKDHDSVVALDRTVVNSDFIRVMHLLDILLPEKGKLLDVGCGCGDFLHLAQDFGWDTSGLDISAYAANKASREGKIKVFVGTLEEADYPAESFDAITAWDFIEHLDDPVAFAQQAKKLLKPSGILVIRTPNQQSLFHWIAGLAYRFGWTYPLAQLYHADHLSYFSRKTLAEVFEKNGLNVEIIEYYDLTIHDSRFQGLKKVIIYGIYLVAKMAGRRHAMIAYIKNNAPSHIN